MAKKKKKQTRSKQTRGLKTHDKLILGAMKLLSESNLSGLRFSKLSKLVKVPQSLIDYHFPSIDSLHMAIIQFKISQLLTFTVDSLEKLKKNPRKAFEAYIKVPFQFAQKDKEFTAVWTAYYHLIATNKSVAIYNNAIQKNGHDRILNLIRGIIVHEGLRLNKNIELEKLAQQIHGVIIGYLTMAATVNPKDYKHWQNLALDNSLLLLNSGLESN